MTLTNQTTILRQIGANGGSGWGLPDDVISEEDIGASIHGKRVLAAYRKYRDALVEIGRPAMESEVAVAAKSSEGATNHFLRTHPEWLHRTEIMRDGKKIYLFELRTN